MPQGLLLVNTYKKSGQSWKKYKKMTIIRKIAFFGVGHILALKIAHSVTNCVQKWENAKFVLKHAKNDFLCIIKYYFNVSKFVPSSFHVFLKHGSFCLICNGKKLRNREGFEPHTCNIIAQRISHYTMEANLKMHFNFYYLIC